jgi:hypothetical protein
MTGISPKVERAPVICDELLLNCALQNLVNDPRFLIMWKTVCKRVIAQLVLVAFLIGALGPFVSYAAASEPCAMIMAKSSTNQDMPPKHATPVCDQGLCVGMAALLTNFVPSWTNRAWTPASYWASADALTGLSTPPEQSPPRSRA